MTLLKIQIKHRLTDAILFEYEKENNTVKDTVIEGVKQRAYLRGADLRGAYLRGADLTGADLTGAYLTGALWVDIKIKKMAVFTGIYRYQVWAVIAEDGKQYIRMGCYFRTPEEWEGNFWNNPVEFPNDKSEASNLRWFAFNTAKIWFQVIELSAQPEA